MRFLDGGGAFTLSAAWLDARVRLVARAGGGGFTPRWRRSYRGAGASCRGTEGGDVRLRALRRVGEREPEEGRGLVGLGAAGERV